MVNRERFVDFFCTLCRIDSLSRREGALAQFVAKELEQLGCVVSFDDAAQKVGGETGNLIARLPGTVSGVEPLLLSAHLDTVGPGEGISPRIDGDVIRSDGTTILGADDKAGLAVIIEVLRTIKEEKLPHGDIEIVFTVCEETGLLGAKYLDYSLLQARHAIVIDAGGAPYNLIVRAPAITCFDVEIFGRAAHAGVEPEKGVSAIQVAATAISQMRLRRIDEETTANVGEIYGGRATNIVPDHVMFTVEARSHNEQKLIAQIAHMKRCIRHATRLHTERIGKEVFRPKFTTHISFSCPRLALTPDVYVAKLIQKAARELGCENGQEITGGASDANIFVQHGIEPLPIGFGCYNAHTKDEYLEIPEALLAENIVLRAIALHATKAHPIISSSAASA